MIRYCFYCKLDTSKEAINKINAINKQEAINYFSKLKKLSVSKFKKLYGVIKND